MLAAFAIVAEDGIERGKTSIVHVRRGERDIAERGRAEFAVILRVLRKVLTSFVLIEAGKSGGVIAVVGEIHAAVASDAVHGVAVEKLQTALCGGRKSGGIARLEAVVIAVA